jgi:sulfur relay (sulfurtransferase) DsrC/TusE family protein
VSFRISPEDAEYMKQQFTPFIDGYDLANLNMREFYCKLQVMGQVKDPFSIKSCYIPDPKINRNYIAELYEGSRAKYARSLAEAKKVLEEKQADVIKTIEDFSEPII